MQGFSRRRWFLQRVSMYGRGSQRLCSFSHRKGKRGGFRRFLRFFGAWRYCGSGKEQRTLCGDEAAAALVWVPCGKWCIYILWCRLHTFAGFQVLPNPCGEARAFRIISHSTCLYTFLCKICQGCRHIFEPAESSDGASGSPSQADWLCYRNCRCHCGMDPLFRGIFPISDSEHCYFSKAIPCVFRYYYSHWNRIPDTSKF